MASAASIEHAARDFQAISSVSVAVLADATFAINALSLHLHGALGPGFDREKVRECAGVEDLLQAPMRRSLALRRCCSPLFSILRFLLI